MKQMLTTIFSFQGHLNHLMVRTAESLEYYSTAICDYLWEKKFKNIKEWRIT